MNMCNKKKNSEHVLVMCFFEQTKLKQRSFVQPVQGCVEEIDIFLLTTKNTAHQLNKCAIQLAVLSTQQQNTMQTELFNLLPLFSLQDFL